MPFAGQILRQILRILMKEPEVFYFFHFKAKCGKNKLKCGLGTIFISFKAQLLSTMAGQLSTACKKPSWVRAFFRVENRSLVDKSTGTEKEIPCDVCCVILDTGIKCGNVYKHHLRHGTKSLQRHVIAKHDSVQAVSDEITKHGLSLSQVVSVKSSSVSS